MSFGRLPAICFVCSAERPENAVTNRIIFGDGVSWRAREKTFAHAGGSGVELARQVLAILPQLYFRAPISYNRGTNTCTLTCHNFSHNADGSVTPAISPKTSVPAKH